MRRIFSHATMIMTTMLAALTAMSLYANINETSSEYHAWEGAILLICLFFLGCTVILLSRANDKNPEPPVASGE